MTQEFTIQCPQCGTLYNELQDVCPYCGEPQPATEPVAPETFAADFFLDDAAMPPREDDMLFDEPVPALPDDESGYIDDPFAEDDIFAVTGGPVAAVPFDEADPQEYATEYDDDYAYNDSPEAWAEPEPYLPQDDQADTGYDLPPDTADFEQTLDLEPEPIPHRLRFRRVALGCLGFLLCVGLLYGGITVLAVRSGLQERAQLAQDESLERYQKGQTLLEQNSIELAIAEFERAVKLNPTFREARDALREAQRLSKLQPTPTSQTRSQAAADIFVQAETQFSAENWADAALTLSQVRDLDPDFKPDQIREMNFEANRNLGQTLLNPEEIESALAAFEQALTEQPDNPDVSAQIDKITLYLQGTQSDDTQTAIQSLRKLYKTDATFLDVQDQLQQAYRRFGDELGEQGDWCAAQTQYTEGNALHPDRALQAKIETSGQRCQGGGSGQARVFTATPAPAAKATAPSGTRAASTPAAAVAITGTAAITGTTTPAAVSSGNGKILFSAFNPFESRWEILAIPASGGAPEVLALNATMPALSPNGQILLYHSERHDSEGIHALNLTTGENIRATQHRQYILPRWSGDDLQFTFVAQEPGKDRWLYYQGFADGKSNPIILGDGRTPDWSPDGKTLAFQGTDPEGNNPGIYLIPFGGGESTRLTDHESDRTPVFSPDGSRIAFMSTRNGNWDIFVVDTAGSEVRAITRAPGNDGLPAWSPDGTRLAFVSDRDGSWAIYTVGLSGNEPAKIAEWDGTNRPDWLTAQLWWGR